MFLNVFYHNFWKLDNAVVRDCHFFMGFLPVQCVIDIRTANFLAKYIDFDNTLCKTLAIRSQLKLNNPCKKYGCDKFSSSKNCMGQSFIQLT